MAERVRKLHSILGMLLFVMLGVVVLGREDSLLAVRALDGRRPMLVGVDVLRFKRLCVEAISCGLDAPIAPRGQSGDRDSKSGSTSYSIIRKGMVHATTCTPMSSNSPIDSSWMLRATDFLMFSTDCRRVHRTRMVYSW